MQNKKTNWVWKSDINSIGNKPISVLSLIETLVAIVLSGYLLVEFQIYIHIFLGLLIAPLLLLKTKKSINDGLILFSEIRGVFFYSLHHYIVYYIVGSIFIYVIYNESEQTKIIFVFLLFLYAFQSLNFTRSDEQRGKFLDRSVAMVAIIVSLTAPFTLGYEGFLGNSINILLGIILGFLVTGAFQILLICNLVKIIVTIKNLSLEAIKAIPSNWKEIVFCTDIFCYPEIIPGIEKSNLANVRMLSYTELKKTFSGFFIKKITFLFIIIALYFPALLYRYLLKSTAIIYLPIIWLITPSNKEDLEGRMKVECQGFQAYFMLFYAVFITIFLSIIPFILHINAIEIYDKLTPFISESIFKILFMIDINLWHITRFLSALITIIFFFNFQRILIRRETNPLYGNFFGAKLLSLNILRKFLSGFSIVCALYLFYKAIPEGTFIYIFSNMKLVPW